MSKDAVSKAKCLDSQKSKLVAIVPPDGARVKGNLTNKSLIVLFHIGAAIIFYKADLSIIVSNQVLQREEPPGVRPY